MNPLGATFTRFKYLGSFIPPYFITICFVTSRNKLTPILLQCVLLFAGEDEWKRMSTEEGAASKSPQRV